MLFVCGEWPVRCVGCLVSTVCVCVGGSHTSQSQRCEALSAEMLIDNYRAVLGTVPGCENIVNI